MKTLLMALSTITTLTISSNVAINSTIFQQNGSNTKKQIMPGVTNTQPKSLINNQYQLLSNSDWITNQSLANHNFYSYDTKHANYQLSNGIDARTVFLVDETGNLVYKPQVTIPAIDRADVDNTRQEMIYHRKVASINNPTNNYSGSQYDNKHFTGDGMNWTYVQQGEVETHIDISQQPNGPKVDHNNSLSEGLAFYYIAKAVKNSSGSFKEEDANTLAHYFISQSSLASALNETLINNIMHLFINNNSVYDYMSVLPFLNIVQDSKYAINYIFDNNNNIIQIYYSYYNKAFDLSQLSLKFDQQIISVKTPTATPINEIKAGLLSKIKDNFKNTLSDQLKIKTSEIDDNYYNIIIENSDKSLNFTTAVNINFKIISLWKDPNQLNFAGSYQGTISVINKCVDLSQAVDLKAAIEKAYYHQTDQTKWLKIDVDNSTDASNVDTKLTKTALAVINSKISDSVKTIVQTYFKTHDTELIINKEDYDVTTNLNIGDDIFNHKSGKDFTISITNNGSTYKLKNSLENINATIHGHNNKNITNNYSAPAAFAIDGIWLKDGKDPNILQEGQHFYEQNKLLKNWVSNQDSLLNTINNNAYNPVANSFTGSFSLNYKLDGNTDGSMSADIAKDINNGKATNFWDLISKTKNIFLETDVDVETTGGWNLNNVKLIFSSGFDASSANTLYTFDLSSKFAGVSISTKAKLEFPSFTFNINYEQVS